MSSIIRALERNETVTLMYRGKVKGRIELVMVSDENSKVTDHPHFGMYHDEQGTVEEKMNQLRKNRFDSLCPSHLERE